MLAEASVARLHARRHHARPRDGCLVATAPAQALRRAPRRGPPVRGRAPRSDEPPRFLRRLAGRAVPARGDVGRRRREFRPLLSARRERRALSVRRKGPPRARTRSAARAYRLRLARLPSRGATRSTLRLSRPRSLPARGGSPLQRQQAVARPLCEGRRRRAEVERRPLRLPRRSPERGSVHRSAQQRSRYAQVPRDRPRIHVGQR